MLYFWLNDLANNVDSGCDYVVHLACVMPVPGKTSQACYILTLNEAVRRVFYYYYYYMIYIAPVSKIESYDIHCSSTKTV